MAVFLLFALHLLNQIYWAKMRNWCQPKTRMENFTTTWTFSVSVSVSDLNRHSHRCFWRTLKTFAKLNFLLRKYWSSYTSIPCSKELFLFLLSFSLFSHAACLTFAFCFLRTFYKDLRTNAQEHSIIFKADDFCLQLPASIPLATPPNSISVATETACAKFMCIFFYSIFTPSSAESKRDRKKVERKSCDNVDRPWDIFEMAMQLVDWLYINYILHTYI